MTAESHLIVNPRSGGFSERRLRGIMGMLAGAGMQPVVHRLDHPAAIESAAREITSPERQPATLMVAGGDGTINCALNGIVSPATVFAVLPLGTANVLSLELGLDSLATAVERIRQGNSRLFSCGLVTTPAGSRRFLLMAGIGYDAEVVRGVGREKRFLGKAAYLLSALRCLLRWDDAGVRLNFSDHQLDVHTLIISNAARYGGNFVIAPGIDVFTPGIQLVAVAPPRRMALAGLLAKILLGIRPRHHCWRLTSGAVEVTGIKPIQLDGDYWGCSPATIRICPDVARIIC